jgi:hypothetical protein
VVLGVQNEGVEEMNWKQRIEAWFTRCEYAKVCPYYQKDAFDCENGHHLLGVSDRCGVHREAVKHDKERQLK